MTYSVALFAVYFLGLTGLAYWLRNTEGSQFAIAGRNVSHWSIVAALAASFRDGAGIAVWIGLAIAFGWGSLWLVVGLSFALFVLAIVGPKLNEIARQREWTTPTDLLRDHYGPITALAGSLVMVLTATLYAGAQVYVAGGILAAFTDIPATIGVIIVVAVTGLYTSIGGYRAVTLTDRVQWLVIAVIVILPFMVPSGPAFPDITSFTSPEWHMSLGFAGLSCLVILSSGDVWQRIFSARSADSARKGLLITIPVYVVISAGLVVFATSLATVLPQEAQADPLFAISTIEALPQLLIGLFGLFVVASLMSTLDTQTFLFTSITEEYVRVKKEDGTPQRSHRVNSAATIGFLALLALIASSIGDIIQFLFSAVTLGTVLTIPFLFATKPRDWRQFDYATTVAILAGVLVYAVLFATGAFADILYTLIPAGVTAAVMSLAIAFSSPPAESC